MSTRHDDGSSSRKRSRWGTSSAAPPPVPSTKPPASSSVTDEDAVNALLSSAKARESEQAPQQQKKRPRPAPQKEAASAEEPPAEKAKPDFGLSGALAEDEVGGNVYKGVLLKFSEPPEARAPNTRWRLYVFKDEALLETLHISKQSAYLFGRNEEIADIPLQHPSSSSQHAVLQYRALPTDSGKLNCQPYLMDLESTNGSFLNDVRIDAARYYQLKRGDVLKFGASKREYVLLTENTKSIK